MAVLKLVLSVKSSTTSYQSVTTHNYHTQQKERERERDRAQSLSCPTKQYCHVQQSIYQSVTTHNYHTQQKERERQRQRAQSLSYMSNKAILSCPTKHLSTGQRPGMRRCRTLPQRADLQSSLVIHDTTTSSGMASYLARFTALLFHSQHHYHNARTAESASFRKHYFVRSTAGWIDNWFLTPSQP